jgi:hypothetical protein
MKFLKLYEQVILQEQDEEINIPSSDEQPVDNTAPSIPQPENFDVEPAPTPALPMGDNNASTLKDYILKFDEFIDKLNGVDGDSLQQLVANIDTPGSMFEGISKQTSSAIIRTAEQIASLNEVLKAFIINSAKKTAQKLRV